MEAVRRTARRVEAALEGVPGLVDVQVEPLVDTPQLVVDVDGAAAAQHGLSRGEAAAAVGLALWGREVGRVFEDGTATAVVARYEDAARANQDQLRGLRVPTPAGASVPLSALADVRRDRAPNYVLRENARRRVAVTANVAGRDLRSVVQDMRAAVATSVEVPAGLRIEYAGQFEQEEAATRRLTLLGLLVVLGIVLLVGGTLRSLRRTAIVLSNLPLALAGGVVGVYLAGGVMNVATTIGFITLFGIAVRNGILLINHYNHLMEAEGVPMGEAIVQGSMERLVPILLTAISAALGLVPLALAAGEPGSELLAPLAIVTLGGLLTSTFLNLIVVPAGYSLVFGHKPEPRRRTRSK